MFSILFLLCIVSIHSAYAEPEFTFKFGSTGTDNDELDTPTDIILDKNDKNAYVVDNKNYRINVFEDDGGDDFIYGSFCDLVAIQNCNDDADGADNIGDGQFNGPISIARDSIGKFFVVDSDNSRVQVFDDNGEFLSKFGSSDSGIDEYLGSPKGITVQESTNRILVSDIERDLISVFDSTGDFLFKFDSFDGNNDFQNPTNMIIDNSNEILFVTDSGNDRIVIFELVDGTTCPSGTEEVVDGVCFVTEFGASGSDNGEFDNPSGLAFDSANDLLYVADTDNNRIQIFQIIDDTTCPNGTEEIVDGVCYVEEFGSTGTTDGKFDAPMGIALDTTNDLLYVADSKNDRIQVFNANPEPPTLIPDKPENLKALPISPTSVIITWNEPEMEENVPTITGYKIEYKIGSDDFTEITPNTQSTATSFIHQGLDSEVYFYRVYSINLEGTSISSSTVSVKPEHTTTPAALTATAIAPSQIKLSWLPPSETFGQTIDGYKIKREIIPGVYDDVGDTNGKTNSFIVSNLVQDKTYTYAVSAKIGFGFTQESNTASATPREDSVDSTQDPIMSTAVQVTVSSPPIKLTASVVSSTQINLSWSPPVEDGNTPITGYKIEVKKDNNAYTTLVENSESNTRTFSHKNLITNSKYTYKVSAINNVGTSDASNEFSATPKSTNIQISPIGKLTIDEGKSLSFSVKLVDKSVQNVVFSLEKNSPTGAKIISNTGMFLWTPSFSNGGKTYTFDVVAKKDGLSDRETITISVNDIEDNSEPKKIPESVTEPQELQIPAAFVDETKDPQSYVDRYNNEASYKKWFDENHSEYDSIYQAVGLEEPKIKEKKFGICGPGTKSIDGVCTIVEKPKIKPWWQFW